MNKFLVSKFFLLLALFITTSTFFCGLALGSAYICDAWIYPFNHPSVTGYFSSIMFWGFFALVILIIVLLNKLINKYIPRKQQKRMLWDVIILVFLGAGLGYFVMLVILAPAGYM